MTHTPPWLGDEVVGEYLPYDGRYLTCPHDPDWRREVHAPVLFVTSSGVSHRRTFVCVLCRYEQTAARPIVVWIVEIPHNQRTDTDGRHLDTGQVVCQKPT